MFWAHDAQVSFCNQVAARWQRDRPSTARSVAPRRTHLKISCCCPYGRLAARSGSGPSHFTLAQALRRRSAWTQVVRLVADAGREGAAVQGKDEAAALGASAARRAPVAALAIPRRLPGHRSTALRATRVAARRRRWRRRRRRRRRRELGWRRRRRRRNFG